MARSRPKDSMAMEHQQGTEARLKLFEVEEGSARHGTCGEDGTGSAAYEEVRAVTPLNLTRALGRGTRLRLYAKPPDTVSAS
ncbi:MAG: hypothetical protein PVF54_11015, partial [Anaerolineae bacterium]